MRALGLLLLAAGCSGGSADYFRLEVGLTWQYDLLSDPGTIWSLEVLPADENPVDDRGDVFVRMRRPEPDPINPGQTIEQDHRVFNARIEQDYDDQGRLHDVAWTYRVVNVEEGDRNETFLPIPGDAADWATTWSYDVAGGAPGASDWHYEGEAARFDAEVETNYGDYDDTIRVLRTHAQTNRTQGGADQVLTRTHEEFWARGVGLVRYRFTSTDGVLFDLILRDSTAIDL